MKKVYMVMHNLYSLGEDFGPDVVGVFGSKEKAIDYIIRAFGNTVFTYNSKTGVYSHEPNFDIRVTRWIVEMELNKGLGDL